MTITVSTSAQLYAALKTVKGGETILLKGGDYGVLALGPKSGFDITFPSNVTIASANAADPAKFSAIKMIGAANVTVDGVVFDYTFKAGDSLSLRPNEITGSQNIKIINSTFDGDVASGVSATSDGFGTGQGLAVRACSGVKIENNEFFNWHRALVVGHSKDVIVKGNDVHDIRSDGMNFVNVQKVLIEKNHIHDFRASYDSLDHRDMIQFWTTGTKTPSTDITIRGNTLDIGDGASTQTIFMRNEMVDTGQAGKAMFYKNVLIEDNTIYNSHLHGITVGETSGLVIRNNALMQVMDANNPTAGGGAVWIPTIRVASKSEMVAITANAVASISGHAAQATWVVKGNAFIQANDPFAPGYYKDIFVTSSMASNGDSHNFVAKPGSMLDLLNAGSSDIRFTAAAADGSALFGVTDHASNGAARVFDAGIMTKAFGAAIMTGAVYTWAFGDGTTATGPVVTHAFASGGDYGVALSVKLINGKTLSTVTEVGVAGPELLSYNAATKSFVAHGYGGTTQLAPVSKLDGAEIQLGGTGTAVTVSRGHLAELRGSDDFTIDLKLQADKVGTGGELFRVHGAFTATVGSSGQMLFQIYMADGQTVKAQTAPGVKLNDGKMHDVSIMLDGGFVKILIDGVQQSKVAASGGLAIGGADLTFGNPWGKANFQGDIAAFSIKVDDGDYVAAPLGGAVKPAPAAALEIATGAQDAAAVVVASPLHRTDWSGYKLNIDALATSKGQLKDNAAVVKDGAHNVIHLDGDRDFVALGRISAYEKSEKIAFSVDFTRDADNTGAQRLVGNHQKVDLSLVGDAMVVRVGTDHGMKAFKMAALGVQDTDLHRATVMLDTVQDRLQVVLDHKVILDVKGTDFEIVGAGGHEWGWNLGAAWTRNFDGEISDFRLGDRFEFLNGYDGQPAII